MLQPHVSMARFGGLGFGVGLKGGLCVGVGGGGGAHRDRNV